MGTELGCVCIVHVACLNIIVTSDVLYRYFKLYLTHALCLSRIRSASLLVLRGPGRPRPISIRFRIRKYKKRGNKTLKHAVVRTGYVLRPTLYVKYGYRARYSARPQDARDNNNVKSRPEGIPSTLTYQRP